MASLTAFFALPSGFRERILVCTHDLCYSKLTPEEDLTPALNHPNKEVLETSTCSEHNDWRFPMIDYTLFRKLPKDPRGSYHQKESSKILQWCDVKNTLPLFRWWDSPSLPLEQRSPWRHMWSPLSWARTQWQNLMLGVLLAKKIPWCHSLC